MVSSLNIRGRGAGGKKRAALVGHSCYSTTDSHATTPYLPYARFYVLPFSTTARTHHHLARISHFATRGARHGCAALLPRTAAAVNRDPLLRTWLPLPPRFCHAPAVLCTRTAHTLPHAPRAHTLPHHTVLCAFTHTHTTLPLAPFPHRTTHASHAASSHTYAVPFGLCSLLDVGTVPWADKPSPHRAAGRSVGSSTRVATATFTRLRTSTYTYIHLRASYTSFPHTTSRHAHFPTFPTLHTPPHYPTRLAPPHTPHPPHPPPRAWSPAASVRSLLSNFSHGPVEQTGQRLDARTFNYST